MDASFKVGDEVIIVDRHWKDHPYWKDQILKVVDSDEVESLSYAYVYVKNISGYVGGFYPDSLELRPFTHEEVTGLLGEDYL